ncbi:MAG: hypothetical protein ACPGF7_05005 [Pontibacterium sp.]
MSDAYKPLFNRTYLRILVWGSAIAVLFLATLGDDQPDYLTLESDKQTPVYWVDYESASTELTLLLPTGSALSTGEKIQQSLLSLVLESQLSAVQLPPAITWQIQKSADHLALTFSGKTLDGLPDWTKLLSALNQPVDAADWHRLAEKFKARIYLQSHQVDNKLLAAYFKQLSGGDLADPLSRLSNRYQSMLSRVRFFLSGEEVEELAETLIDQLPKNQPTALPLRMLNITATQKSLPFTNDSRYHLLIGGPVPARTNALFAAHRLAAHSLQIALNQQAQQQGFEYRMLWSSLQDAGYQALLLHSDLPLANQLQAINNKLSPELVTQSREQLITQWQTRMSEEGNQVEALKVVAFYGLPDDTLKQYPQQLRALSIEQVLQIAQQSIQPDQQIRIQLTANPK